jgi:hypothetical protein
VVAEHLKYMLAANALAYSVTGSKSFRNICSALFGRKPFGRQTFEASRPIIQLPDDELVRHIDQMSVGQMIFDEKRRRVALSRTGSKVENELTFFLKF